MLVKKMNSIKRYSELIKFNTFEDRFNYLKLDGYVGEETFGFERYLNQNFYRSNIWKPIRDKVIIRDNGCDLGLEGFDIFGKIIIHHLNPITSYDVLHQTDLLLDPEYLISTTLKTHNALHYGNINNLVVSPIERKPNDTIPWR